MKLDSVVIEMLCGKCGYDVTTPPGAESLQKDIESSIGERLSINTVKRLTGIIPYDSSPRPITLEIISRYLGYSSWKILEDEVNGKISGFESGQSFIEVSSLRSGVTIIMEWEPNRKIFICHLGEGICKVVSSTNSKLIAGDLLKLSQIAEGFPFIVKEVIRDGKSLGNYNAARAKGVKIIKILHGE